MRGRSCLSSVVVEAVRLICAGELFAPLSALLAGRELDGERHDVQREDRGRFPPRQVQILRCLRKGMANKQIAYELGMSEGTVKVHIRRLMQKLEVANRTQIVVRTQEMFEHA